jgi:hypothetical protein
LKGGEVVSEAKDDKGTPRKPYLFKAWSGGFFLALAGNLVWSFPNQKKEEPTEKNTFLRAARACISPYLGGKQFLVYN